MTDRTPRTVEIPLSFLSPGKYRAKNFSDGSNAAKGPTEVDIKEISITSADIIKAEMAPCGGQAVHIYPER
jgi:alpha-glucosidase